MRRIRVLVADEHRLIIEGLKARLGDDERIEVVGWTHSGPQVLPLVARLRPNVVMVDVGMPKIDGLRCLELIRQWHPQVKVILLTGLPEGDVVAAGRERGAAAVLGKGVDPDLLAQVVVQVADGEEFMPAGFASAAPPDAFSGLRPRELSILAALAAGSTNREIAKSLFIAEQTVKFHLGKIYAKLGVGNRTAAARFAYEQGLAESPLRRTTQRPSKSDSCVSDRAAGSTGRATRA